MLSSDCTYPIWLYRWIDEFDSTRQERLPPHFSHPQGIDLGDEHVMQHDPLHDLQCCWCVRQRTWKLFWIGRFVLWPIQIDMSWFGAILFVLKSRKQHLKNQGRMRGTFISSDLLLKGKLPTFGFNDELFVASFILQQCAKMSTFDGLGGVNQRLVSSCLPVVAHSSFRKASGLKVNLVL